MFKNKVARHPLDKDPLDPPLGVGPDDWRKLLGKSIFPPGEILSNDYPQSRIIQRPAAIHINTLGGGPVACQHRPLDPSSSIRTHGLLFINLHHNNTLLESPYLYPFRIPLPIPFQNPTAYTLLESPYLHPFRIPLPIPFQNPPTYTLLESPYPIESP